MPKGRRTTFALARHQFRLKTKGCCPHFPPSWASTCCPPPRLPQQKHIDELEVFKHEEHIKVGATDGELEKIGAATTTSTTTAALDAARFSARACLPGEVGWEKARNKRNERRMRAKLKLEKEIEVVERGNASEFRDLQVGSYAEEARRSFDALRAKTFIDKTHKDYATRAKTLIDEHGAAAWKKQVFSGGHSTGGAPAAGRAVTQGRPESDAREDKQKKQCKEIATRAKINNKGDA